VALQVQTEQVVQTVLQEAQELVDQQEQVALQVQTALQEAQERADQQERVALQEQGLLRLLIMPQQEY
jgi:uncharacterized protein (DUF1778 family)